MSNTDTSDDKRTPLPPGLLGPWVYTAWVLLFAFLWASMAYGRLFQQQVLSYSEFKQELEAGRVVSCEVDPQEIRGLFRPGTEAAEPGEEAVAFRTIRVDDPDLLADLREARVEVTGRRPSAWPKCSRGFSPSG